MLYNIGDTLICKKRVDARCLEITNPSFNIGAGDKYIVTDKDNYPNNNNCHWYELTSKKDNSIVLNAWNDEEHMIIDDSFEKE